LIGPEDRLMKRRTFFKAALAALAAPAVPLPKTPAAVLGGGRDNFVGGSQYNTIRGHGHLRPCADAQYSFVGGGFNNTALDANVNSCEKLFT